MRRGGQDIVSRHIKDLYMQESVQVLGRTRLSPSHVELTPSYACIVHSDGMKLSTSCNCPIRCVDDGRLSWLKNDFIGSLLEWENEHGGDEKSFLARPTLEGLKFTTHNFIEMCKYLLANGLEYVSLHCFNQDVLEALFRKFETTWI
uniref:uncharacterized protein LOC120341497 n=1 Tax=Styela clava TaxID=7725 RepID=UPI00193A11BA|nr:uncharacterized protein LOC120341497 [Styela clava]